jgi:sterol desaturase/sphingolipid hydroxylase (fatty acid hydroxylase superfamily)
MQPNEILSAAIGNEAARSVLLVLCALAALTLIEALIPLRAAMKAAGRRRANLAMTALTLATNSALNVAVVLALAAAAAADFGLFNRVAAPAPAAVLLVVIALDLSSYFAHVAMHGSPMLWAFHRIHHSDLHVDATTGLRQHPVESLWRYLFLLLFALPLGASPEAFGLFRVLSAAVALLEHANIEVPPALDRALARVTTFPGLHKNHHARDRALADSNYGNILSVWDRMFGTLTPPGAIRGAYGLEGCDGPEYRSFASLLAAPFQRRTSAREA